MDAREGNEGVKDFPPSHKQLEAAFSRHGAASGDTFGKVRKPLSLLGEGKDQILNLYF